MSSHSLPSSQRLHALQPGQLIPFGGDRVTSVPAALAEQFEPGDRLVVVQETGALLHIPAGEQRIVAAAVGAATEAFAALAQVTDDQITMFYESFAEHLADPAAFSPIQAANDADVSAAAARGRSTTRLVLSTRMHDEMIQGLRVWRDAPGQRDADDGLVEHDDWSVTARRAPLGVVGFVFEGRPNVFADATGVIRSGNTTVMRIGSDALGTARAIMQHTLVPAIRVAGLPEGSVTLIDSPSRAAAWALFGDARLGLAVARGSGEAVAQLGSVARQTGVPVSLHGEGGAWLIASAQADLDRFIACVTHSLDRKVCNTLNVCCVVAERASELVAAFVASLRGAATARGVDARLHVAVGSEAYIDPRWLTEQVKVQRADGTGVEPFADVIPIELLGHEWEWEASPEVTLIVVDSLEQAVTLFNEHSPRLAASLISDDPAEQQRFYDTCDAPFIGDGFTRWVDGQFALLRPELGLSNWQHGRLFARSAVLSGDSVYTVRLVARFGDHNVRR